MMVRILAFLIGFFVSLAFGDLPAFAKPVCKEGKTASGKCVNPSLGQVLRQRTIVTTQRKISYTGAPVAKTRDPQYESTRDGMQQQLRLEGSGPVGNGPPLCTTVPLSPQC
jgi:hypothetical protein